MEERTRIFRMGRVTGQIDILRALTQLPECPLPMDLIEAKINEHSAYLRGLYDTADKELQLFYNSEYKQQIPHAEA